MAKTRHIVAALVLSLFLPAFAAPPTESKIVLPLHATPQGNAVYIEGQLNGHHANLILDTGSTLSECDKQICGKSPKATATMSFGSWHSDTQEVKTRDFSDVSKQTGIKVDGILGVTTMNTSFRRVTLDFERAVIELEPR